MPDLSDGVNWSEVDADNNHPAPNGWPEGMMPSGVNDAARADRGALKRFWDKINPVLVITPVSGLYTFTTANPAYPTAYVDGEIYCFHPTDPSVGGDYFQVNALDPKPIWKRMLSGASGFAPIIAQDIQPTGPVQLVYMAFLNHGDGAFILLNPFVPIHGDGVGGVSANGTLTVNGGDLLLGRTDEAYSYVLRPATPVGLNNLAFAATGGTPLNDVQVITNQMEVTGRLSATGYSSRSGVAGPYQPNVFNIQWTGTQPHLWIDTTDVGPILIGSGGTITGDVIVVGTLTSQGHLTVNSGADITGGAVVGTGFAVNGQTTLNGGLDITGTYPATGFTLLANGPVYTGNLTAAGTAAVSGAATVDNGLNVTGTYPATGYTLLANGPAFTGNLTVSGGATVSGDEAVSGGIAVGVGIGVVGPGSINVAGNYYRNSVVIPVLTEAWMTQYDELVARVQALEAALTARTE